MLEMVGIDVHFLWPFNSVTFISALVDEAAAGFEGAIVLTITSKPYNLGEALSRYLSICLENA
jgi:hypothetical protein